MALSAQGFSRRTYDDILNDKIAKAVELFGSDIDTSELTPLGKFIRIGAYDQAIAEEEIEDLYYAIFPDTATGASLDRLLPFVGISRLQATAASYTMTVKGTAGTEIEYGFLVGTESKVTFFNTHTETIGSDGTVDITVECETKGTIGNVNASEINEVVNPTAGVTSVVGTAVVSVGTDTEDDVALRNRFAQAREGMGSCNENAIRAALLRVPTVTSAGVIVNDTDSADSSGRPAHSFECYVAGGESYHQQIAETIFDKKPIGVKTHGTVSQTIVDDSGTSRTIKFSHTTAINVYVKVSVKTNSAFEGTNGKAEIQSNIQAFINGLGIGKSVVLSSLYGKIHAVTGVVEVTSLQLSTDGTTWTSSNVTVSQWQKAQCSEVTVTEVT